MQIVQLVSSNRFKCLIAGLFKGEYELVKVLNHLK